MDKKKIAVIGVGGISECHIAGYKKNPNVELVAFCDINETRLREKGAKHGVTNLFTDVHQMLAAMPEIDAVSVCTWNCAHAPCSIAALNAGKDVLCEKPMAMNAAEAQQMLDAARRSGRLLMIGFVRRHGNDCRILRDFIEAGAMGDIYYAKAAYLRRHGCPGGLFSDSARSGGGPLIDLGVHVIDLARYLGGCPHPVSAYGATFSQLGCRPEMKNGVAYRASDEGATSDVEDFATGLIRFDNGMVIAIETSYDMNLPGDNNITLLGTKAGATLSPEIKLFPNMEGYPVNVQFDMPTELSFDGLFDREINHYIDCISGKADCIAPAEDGVTMMKILDALYESARTGHEVRIAD